MMPNVQRAANGLAWELSLTHNDVQVLAGAGGLAALAIPPPVDIAVGAAIGYIELIDEIGGQNGVDVCGAVGFQGCVVTPHGLGMFQIFSQAVGIVAAAGQTIADFIYKLAWSVSHGNFVVNNPGIFIGFLVGGLPGSVLGGFLDHIFGNHQDPPRYAPEMNIVGGVCPNRRRAAQWETFALCHVGPGNIVGLLSWQGFFSAQNTGGAGVFANRPNFGAWERWTFIRNPDNTVSFLAADGNHCFTAPNGGPNACWANGINPPGPDERFIMDYVGTGNVTLRTQAKNLYVSVQDVGQCQPGIVI